MAVNATNDITSELAKLHRLTGADFSRQVECIARRKEFHPLATDKDIFTTGGEQSDDYENLLLADGPVAPVAFDMPRLVDEVTLSVDFEKNPLHRVVHPDDFVYLAAYCPELGDFDLSEPAYRRSNRLTMSMNDYWVGREVHLWGFVADSKGRASRSQYLGCVVLSAEMVGNDVVGDSYDHLSLLLDNACSAQNGDAADAADDHLRGAHGGVVDLPDVGALGAGSSLGGAVP